MTNDQIPNTRGRSNGLARPAYRQWRWVALALLVVVLWLSRGSWLPLLSTFLDVSQSPRQADFIVLLGGGKANRAQAAVDLYQQGFAPRVIISGGPLYRYGIECSTALLTLDDVQRMGLPADVVLLSDEATSTWDETQQLLALLEQEGALSALIVTDPVHTRRTRATYRKLQTTQAIELTFVAAEATFPTHRWWQSEEGLIAVQNEYIKLAYYLLDYGVWPW